MVFQLANEKKKNPVVVTDDHGFKDGKNSRAFGVSEESISELLVLYVQVCVCRCFMHTAVVIVPLFSHSSCTSALCLEFLFKLFEDTGKAEFCVQCHFNKTVFSPFFYTCLCWFFKTI